MYFWHIADKIDYLFIDTIGYYIGNWSYINKINLSSLKKFCQNDGFEQTFRFTWGFLMANFIQLYKKNNLFANHIIVSLVNIFSYSILAYMSNRSINTNNYIKNFIQL